MKKGIKAGIGIAIVAAIFGGGYWGVTSYIDSQSPRKVVKGTSGTAIHIEEVSFYEGLNKIYGKAYMPQDTLGRKPVVIYCHGLGQNGDESDALCPLERQKYMLQLVLGICEREFVFDDFEQCRDYFKNMINILRQMNYSEFKSEKFNQFSEQLTQLLESNGK